MIKQKAYIVLFLCLLLSSCCGSRKSTPPPAVATPEPKIQKAEVISNAVPHAIVYKTKKDYSQNVPVILSDDKTRIVSYPSIRDIYYKGELAYPTKLSDGFWLDNRGINLNVAFTKYTYEEYSTFEKTPSIEALFDNIIDINPLVTIVDCGNKYKYEDNIEALNQLIKDNFPGLSPINLYSE